MASYDMSIIIGGVVLPAPSTFKDITKPNETDNVTMGGTLYTDFININRSWVISWKLLKDDDFKKIYALYRQQYINHYYHVLQFNAYNILTPAKIEISDINPKFNGSLTENFSIKLIEKYAIS